MRVWVQVAHNPVVDVAKLEFAHVDLLASAEALARVHLIRHSQERVFLVGPCIAGQEKRLELPWTLHKTLH